jgi:hypothetical protein
MRLFDHAMGTFVYILVEASMPVDYYGDVLEWYLLAVWYTSNPVAIGSQARPSSSYLRTEPPMDDDRKCVCYRAWRLVSRARRKCVDPRLTLNV